MPWEGGYVGATYDSYDLLTDALGDIPLNHGELISDVVGSLPQHAWAQRDYLRLRPADRLSSAWEDFGTIVKHHRRYFFAGFRNEGHDDDDYLTPGELLDQIGRAVREAELVVELGECESVYRVRPHPPGEGYETADDLGAPRVENVKNASRMARRGHAAVLRSARCGDGDRGGSLRGRRHGSLDGRRVPPAPPRPHRRSISRANSAEPVRR